MKVSKTCLISGGAGFIGSHLSESLLEKGFQVICLDNLITGNLNNISPFLENPNFKFINKDASLPLTDDLGHIDYIYHLASPASPEKYQKYSLETMQVNSQGTWEMLSLAHKNNAQFLLASTSEVYGDPLVHPQKESYFGNVNPIGIRACYDESKRFAESLTMEFIRKKDADCRIVRIFNTYGPKMLANDGRVVSNFIYQALLGQPLTVYGDGRQTRSFCFVSDMVEGLIKAMTQKDTKGKVINLGNPDERQVLEIAHLVLQLTSSSSKIIFKGKPPDDPLRRKPDITLAKNLLGWQPQVDLQEGLKKTIAYFKTL